MKSSEFGDVDLSRLLSCLRRDWLRIVLVSFAIAAAVFALTMMAGSTRAPNTSDDAYLAGRGDAALPSNANLAEWPGPEVADLRERVRAAEARVAEFRAQSGLLTTRNDTALLAQQMAELSSELSRVRAKRSASEAGAGAIREAIEGGAPLETVPEVLASELVQRLREREVELTAEIAELSTTLLGNHPQIRALQSQLAGIESHIRVEAQKVQEVLMAEAATARRREAGLLVELDRMKIETARAEEDQVELRSLEREATTQRELLESYLIRYRAAANRVDNGPVPVMAGIFSHNTMSSGPHLQRAVQIALAVFAASLLLMVIAMLLRELFRSRVTPYALDQMEPILVAEGAAGGSASFKPAEPPHTPLASENEPEGVDAGRACSHGEVDEIEVAAEALISKGIARAIFISPEGDEAAATAVLVAREVADAGLRVLLIDLTPSGAVSHPMLESRSYPGISNLLAAEAQFADVIHADLYSSCHVIPVGTADPQRAMRGVDRLPIIMDSLTIAYDLVVVECGPAAGGVALLMGEDTQVFVSVLDPHEDRIGTAAAELKESGFDQPMLVTPVGYVPPTAPPDRHAA